MFLFVWDNVLTDWSSGIMFAVARTVDEAREAYKAAEGDRSTVYRESLAEPTKTIPITPETPTYVRFMHGRRLKL